MIEQALQEMGELSAYSGSVFRIVETQEYAATTGLVDDLDEQSLLEQLLDEVKPRYRQGTQTLHYLISTPFRYPPLKYGSRFGDITMPSYFYASEELPTALAECAYYRFVFLNDITIAYHKAVTSEHMSFNVDVATMALADLTTIDTPNIARQLICGDQYSFTQRIGKTLVQHHGAKALRFYSARATREQGINVALTEPSIIISRKPQNNVNWICHTTAAKISFIAHGYQPTSFTIDQFLIAGQLPRLA